MNSKNKNQGMLFPDPNEKTGLNGCNKEMNRIFYEWIMDNIHKNNRVGELAKQVIAKGISHTDKMFPRWRDYERIAIDKFGRPV